MINLQPSKNIEILTIIDNTSDIGLKDTTCIKRFPRLDSDGEIWKTTLMAEHGLSLLIRASSSCETHAVMMDAGFTETAMAHNLKLLNLNLTDIKDLVISHGHRDHNGGLPPILQKVNKPCNIIAHPDALLQRYVESVRGRIKYPGHLARKKLEKYQPNIIENSAPLLISGGFMLVTGYIPRKTSFEKVPQGSLIDRNGNPEPDNISDDQSIILSLKDKGLVVISGCAHSGIVNTVNYAVEITGINKIYAVIGGFHLSGSTSEYVINETIAGLKRFEPEVLAPVHCTGFRAQCLFEREFAEAYQINSVGSKILL